MKTIFPCAPIFLWAPIVLGWLLSFARTILIAHSRKFPSKSSKRKILILKTNGRSWKKVIVLAATRFLKIWSVAAEEPISAALNARKRTGINTKTSAMLNRLNWNSKIHSRFSWFFIFDAQFMWTSPLYRIQVFVFHLMSLPWFNCLRRSWKTTHPRPISPLILFLVNQE